MFTVWKENVYHQHLLSKKKLGLLNAAIVIVTGHMRWGRKTLMDNICNEYCVMWTALLVLCHSLQWSLTCHASHISEPLLTMWDNHQFTLVTCQILSRDVKICVCSLVPMFVQVAVTTVTSVHSPVTSNMTTPIWYYIKTKHDAQITAGGRNQRFKLRYRAVNCHVINYISCFWYF